MDLVVNEWLPEYFRPNASREEKLLLEKFLQRFMESKDRIVVREASLFVEKYTGMQKKISAGMKW